MHKVGDLVTIVKKGSSMAGKTARVLEPNWYGTGCPGIAPCALSTLSIYYCPVCVAPWGACRNGMVKVELDGKTKSCAHNTRRRLDFPVVSVLED